MQYVVNAAVYPEEYFSLSPLLASVSGCNANSKFETWSLADTSCEREGKGVDV